MKNVQVYISGQRLELFSDEQISVKSTQQNISDISKVMTDFSQSFNIPASPHNNAIMQHFYQSDVDSTIDHNIRRSAVIEIEHSEFRKGKISLEGSKILNGQADSYSITFYGENVSIKDKFGDEKLSDITELNAYTYDYTGANVKASVSSASTDDNIRFPLITPRQVSYGTGDAVDIKPSTGTGAIHYDELSPAIKIKAILSAIQTRYGITLNGTFLEDERVSKAFLLCKNANDFQFYTKKTDADFISVSNDFFNESTLYDASTYYDLATDTLSYGYTDFNGAFPVNLLDDVKIFESHKVTLKVGIPVANPNTEWFVDMYDNGVLLSTTTGVDTTLGYGVDILTDSNYVGMNRSLTFKIRTTAPVQASIELIYTQRGQSYNTPNDTQDTHLNIYRAQTGIFTLNSTFDMLSHMPDMKVLDFFKGFLEMFNLTCYGTDTDIYTVEPINDWYLKGAIVDITEHVLTDTISVDKVPLYKQIDFEYQEAQSLTNVAFKSVFGRGYGDASSTFNYDDGGEFKVSLPFENIMFNKFLSTDLQVGFTVDSSGAKYTPKPTILYMNGTKTADYGFNDGTHHDLTEYVVFGQDLNSNSVNYSLNFGADNSTITGEPVQYGLYATYYHEYLSNLYNLKNRRTKLKTILPTSLITSLELNDRLIIQGKRYLINEMSTNLTSGEVTFDLLHDFKDTLNESTGGGTGEITPAPVDPFFPDNTAQCLDVRILLPHGVASATVSDYIGNIVSITPTTLTEDGFITVCLPSNEGATGVIITEDGLFDISTEDDSDDLLQEESFSASSVVYILQITYTYTNGTSASTLQYIIQEP